MAINGWRDYFSVATQSFMLNAGERVALTVTPTAHSYTAEFKSYIALEKGRFFTLYAIENRRCRSVLF